jgi:hypothetical protein
VTWQTGDDSSGILQRYEKMDNVPYVRPQTKRFFQQTEIIMNGDLYFTDESWPEVQCRTLIADRIDWTENSLSNAVQQYEKAKIIFTDPPHDRQGESLNS